MPLLVPSNRRPITPGAILREDFLEPLGLTQGKAAELLGIDRTSLNELLNGRRNMTTEMALRLGHAFGTSPQYWLNLQMALDLFDTQQSEVAAEIERQPILIHMSQYSLSIEKREQGDYAVRRPNAKRASAVEPTQAKAEKRAREIEPTAVILTERVKRTERVKQTAKGKPYQWRKGDLK
ncbi:MAG TPA: HigA family addiction module antitoxin [Candidatus Cybelea sp.]|jgi:addiction module HigA family antidote